MALKPIEQAKSRLVTVVDPVRRQLAWSMALDTLVALSPSAAEIVVVSEQGSLQALLERAGLAVTVVPEPGPVGLNGALSHGAELLRGHGCTLVLACVGDLPALRPDSVRRVVDAARGQPRSFLADASGSGTTMLLAADQELEPHFGGPSAAAHRASGAVALTDDLLGGPVADARRDVDTEADLREAFSLGLGRATAELLDPGTGTPSRYT